MQLRDVCKFIVDCPHSTAKDEGLGYPLIRTPNIGKGRLLLDNVHRVSEQVYRERTQRGTPEDGDIIFAREAPAGNAALVTNGEKVCLGQRTVLIRPNTELVNPQFLVYYLLGPEQQYKLLGNANGATVDHVNLPIIRNLPIQLPDRKIQDKIADILSTYDDLIENNKKQIKLLEEAAQRLYKEWFVDLHFPGYENTKIIDGVPEGWKKSSLEAICELQETIISVEELALNCPYIGLEHMPRKDFCLASFGQAQDSCGKKYFFEEDDIIFAKIRPYFHKVGFAITSGVVSLDSFVIKSQKGFWGLLLMTMFSEDFVNYSYRTCKEGAKMPRADWNQMKKYHVKIPDDQIRKEFEKNIWSITRRIKVLAFQNKNLLEARDRLLPKLIQGEIDL